MRISSGSKVLLLAAATPLASGAPNQWTIDTTAFAALPPSSGLTTQIASSITSWLSPLWKGNPTTSDLTSGDHSEYSIYDVITTNEHFTQLAKAVNYSSDATKDLLKGKTGAKLTIFAPVNVPRKHHHDEDAASLHAASGSHSASSLMQSTSSWTLLQEHISEYEAAAFDVLNSDDDDKERRRKRLAHFIDAVLRYHLVDAHEPVFARALADNSTVGTQLAIRGKGAQYVGNLNDGLPLRVRVGKSLLPRPGVYLNFYSRVIYPDVKLSNGILHAVQYPLFQFPSILQGLFSAQPEFSTLTTAALKLGVEGYLALPQPKHHGGHDEKEHDDHGHHQEHHHPSRGLTDAKGTEGSTLFAPSNVAWDRLPWGFRAYLFSPWGASLLGKIIMLHSIPNDIVYADSVHHVSRHGHHEDAMGTTVTYDEPSLISKLWGQGGDHPPPHSSANVTRYTFDSVLPKLPEDGDGKVPPPDEATEFEQVDVEVWRYYILPGNKGPRQTAIKVQGNWVAIPDVVNVNGATHLLNSFIKPKEHPHKGLWAEVAQEAERFGFGSVDLLEEARVNAW